MAKIVNIVAGGDLGHEIRLETVKAEVDDMDGVSAEFSGEGDWQLLIRFEEEGTIILYRTGKYILRGGSDYQNLDVLNEMLIQLFTDTPIEPNDGDFSYDIQNIVFLEELESEINLNHAVIQLGMENIEYEPEQFPGLIFRPEGFGLVMLIFSTGKIIITGSTSETEVKEAVEYIQEVLFDT